MPGRAGGLAVWEGGGMPAGRLGTCQGRKGPVEIEGRANHCAPQEVASLSSGLLLNPQLRWNLFLCALWLVFFMTWVWWQCVDALTQDWPARTKAAHRGWWPSSKPHSFFKDSLHEYLSSYFCVWGIVLRCQKYNVKQEWSLCPSVVYILAGRD